MNTLQAHLDRLVAFIQDNDNCPFWSQILIVEDGAITRRKVEGKYISFVPRHALNTPDQYAGRFDKYVNGGYHWINMNAAGIVDDTLLVVVELPDRASVVAADKASVNLSGVRVVRGKAQWEASEWLRLID